MLVITETNSKINAGTNSKINTKTKEPSIVKGKKLNLKRETVHNLNDRLLSSQGWSLWTCDSVIHMTGK
jgi:hypothetical protein